MSKRVLLEINLFDKLFKSFLKSKSEKKELDFIKKMRKINPELADKWSDWNSTMDRSLVNIKHSLEKKGLDTTEIDKVLNIVVGTEQCNRNKICREKNPNIKTILSIPKTISRRESVKKLLMFSLEKISVSI